MMVVEQGFLYSGESFNDMQDLVGQVDHRAIAQQV